MPEPLLDPGSKRMLDLAEELPEPRASKFTIVQSADVSAVVDKLKKQGHSG